ncbi:MAG: glycosyltransferase family 2 protein [Candidatus Spechtbacterales bacterium]
MEKAKNNYPEVGIVVLNWNNEKDTIECLESLKRVSYSNFYVVLVDNNSSDGSRESLERYSKELGAFKCIFIRNSENKGFAGGNNTGIDYVVKNGSDYVLVLNNDTYVDPLFIDGLVREAEKNKKAAIVGSAIYFYNKPRILWFGGDSNISWHKMDKAISNSLLEKELPESIDSASVKFITGACMLLRSEALKELKGFDERFFLYFEDADLSFRAIERGWDLRWTPFSKILHKVSATTLPQAGSARMNYYNTRNILLLAKEHGPWWMMFYRHMWAFYTLAKQCVKIIIGRNREVSRHIAKGVLDYYRKNFGM